MSYNDGQRYSITVFGLTGIPEVQPGNQLGSLIWRAASDQGSPLEEGDILVVTQKIVSKAEGRLVSLSTITPSDFAIQFARHAERDPRLVELVLRESKSIVRMDPDRGVIISETHHGFMYAQTRELISRMCLETMSCVCFLKTQTRRRAESAPRYSKRQASLFP